MFASNKELHNEVECPARKSQHGAAQQNESGRALTRDAEAYCKALDVGQCDSHDDLVFLKLDQSSPG
jgi:hypothetical protein